MTEKTTPQAGGCALKPCPFCGAIPTVKAVASDWWKLLIDHDNECMLSGHFDDAIVPQDDACRATLIGMWNRRTAPGAAAAAPEASDDLARRLMDAARRDALTWADRHAIGQAIGRLQSAAKEIHDLNWALGTEGYDKMHDPADQAAAEEAVRGTDLFIQRMAAVAERQKALVADAERYRHLTRTMGSYCVTRADSDGDFAVLKAGAADAAIDADRAAVSLPQQGGDVHV